MATCNAHVLPPMGYLVTKNYAAAAFKIQNVVAYDALCHMNPVPSSTLSPGMVDAQTSASLIKTAPRYAP